MQVPFISDFNIVGRMREKETECHPEPYYPTDSEIRAAVKVFFFLIDLASLLRLQELSAWAVTNYTVYNGIAQVRKL